MELYDVEKDINVLCVEVPTFPNGIPEAFDKLSKVFPTTEQNVFMVFLI